TSVGTAAKASSVRRTNRKTATTAVLDRPGDDESAAATGTDPAPSARRNRRRGARIGTSLLVLAVLLPAAAVLTRALSVSRVPWGTWMHKLHTPRGTTHPVC